MAGIIIIFIIFVCIFLAVDAKDTQKNSKPRQTKLAQKPRFSGLILLSFYAITSLILFSIFGLTINLFINYKAVLFQFGEATRVDSDVLADYLFIRNLFMGVGLSLGGLYGLIKFHHQQLMVVEEPSNLK